MALVIEAVELEEVAREADIEVEEMMEWITRERLPVIRVGDKYCIDKEILSKMYDVSSAEKGPIEPPLNVPTQAEYKPGMSPLNGRITL